MVLITVKDERDYTTQLVVPKAVNAAARMLIAVWMTNFTIFFLSILNNFIVLPLVSRGLGISLRHDLVSQWLTVQRYRRQDRTGFTGIVE